METNSRSVSFRLEFSKVRLLTFDRTVVPFSVERKEFGVPFLFLLVFFLFFDRGRQLVLALQRFPPTICIR